MLHPTQNIEKQAQRKNDEISEEERLTRPMLSPELKALGAAAALLGSAAMFYAARTSFEQYNDETALIEKTVDMPKDGLELDAQHELDPNRLLELGTVFTIASLGYAGLAAASGKSAVDGQRRRYKYSQLKKAASKK